MLRLVLLRTAAAQRPWLGYACKASDKPLPGDLSCFKNQLTQTTEEDADPLKAWNEHFKGWSARSTLLPAMRPTVFVTLDEFPKNAAGKTDRGKLPDAASVMEKVSDATTFSFEAATTEDELKMVAIWEKVLKGRQVGVNTPFVAYGGHSLTAVQLCSAIFAEFGKRPDILFLTSADCTVRELLKKLKRGDDSSAARDGRDSGCVVRYKQRNVGGMPLLIFGAAGTSAAAYQAVAEASKLDVHFVELPGRGRRASEPPLTRFEPLFENLMPDVMKWANWHRRFFVWGDSLGAVIAYEFTRRFEESNSIQVMGFFVSGNAGPAEASREQGVGSTVQLPGCQVTSSADLEEKDWKNFLLAAAESEEMKQLLNDPELAKPLIAATRADCLVYESYHLTRQVRLSTPIITICGSQDQIASPELMKTWKKVAKGRIDHSVIPKAGHRISQECPGAVASLVHLHSLPNFDDELTSFRSYRASYALLRRKDHDAAAHHLKQGTTMKWNRLSSPHIGAQHLPKDFNPSELNLDALNSAPTITPQSKSVILMRHGNLEWRGGNSGGNPLRMP